MNNLKRILNLAKRTGDKIIVTDENGDLDFVLMPLRDYEKIVTGQDNVQDLSERELWDKVDRDIALWKDAHPEEDYFSGPDLIDRNYDWEDDDYISSPIDHDPWDEPLVKPFPDEDWMDEDDDEPFDVAQGDSSDDESEDENWVNPLHDEKFNPFDFSDNKKTELETEEENFDSSDEFENEVEEESFDFAQDDLSDDKSEDDHWSKEKIQTATVGEALEFIEKHEAKSEPENKSRFAIPKERIKTEKLKNEETEEQIDKTETHKIQYEDIPPPPDIKIEDLAGEENTEPEKVIDASFDENDDFDEEDVYFED